MQDAVLRTLTVLDIITDPLPTVDMVFTRDCLVHFPIPAIHRAIANVKMSGSRMFAATTFPGYADSAPGRGNAEIQMGSWRPLDLQSAPFNLPEPIAMLHEWTPDQQEPNYAKCIGVWEIKDL